MSASDLRFGSRTDVGYVREHNEDSLVVTPPLLVIADGMGGHAAGEVASEIAVKTIAECAPDHFDVEELGAAVEVANREIINAALSGQGREGMGTTCTAALVDGNHLGIAQVGDSRAYLLSGGKLTQLTRDHSLMADMIESGRITPEEARFHPQRSVITRALGSDVNMKPDLYEMDVREGDRLLLCSDGLSSMVPDERIQEVLRTADGPQTCAEALVDEALRSGGHDNVTVIVADIEGTVPARKRTAALKAKLTAGIVLSLLVVLVIAAFIGGNAYLHNSAYLAKSPDGYVQVYRGAPGDLMGFAYSELVETTDVPVDSLNPSAAQSITENMRVSSLEEALALVDSYRQQRKEGSSSAESASSSAEAQDHAAESASSAGSTEGR